MMHSCAQVAFPVIDVQCRKQAVEVTQKLSRHRKKKKNTKSHRLFYFAIDQSEPHNDLADARSSAANVRNLQPADHEMQRM